MRTRMCMTVPRSVTGETDSRAAGTVPASARAGRMSIRAGCVIVAVTLLGCWGGGGTQHSKRGDNNVCGDGTCSVTEVENCATCAADCTCPDILVCARELTPPRCILPTAVSCPNDGQSTAFTFCLVQPNKRIDDCIDRFESTVTACTRDEAAAIAQSTAADDILHDGPCPPC